MELKVDAIASPVLFEDEDTGLVELEIEPEDEEKYSFVRPSSAPADLMDRPGRAIAHAIPKVIQIPSVTLQVVECGI